MLGIVIDFLLLYNIIQYKVITFDNGYSCYSVLSVYVFKETNIKYVYHTTTTEYQNHICKTFVVYLPAT